MSRKSVLAIMFVLFALCAATFAFNKPQPALAQEAIKTGTLEGIIVDSEGEPVRDLGSPAIELFLDGQSIGMYHILQGGRYHIEGLKKGLYQMVVNINSVDIGKRDRVKRYLGLLIKPGKPLQRDVKLTAGQGVEQVGQDAVDYPNVIIVSETLEKMQKRIDDLEKQVAELKKK